MTDLADVLAARILVVDDQPANAKLLEYMLEAAGYTAVTTCLDGRQVPALHQRLRFDLILLDLNMPHMNGFQVLQALAPLEPGSYLPVLAITAEPAYKLRALQAGAKDFLSKPVEQNELTARVHNLLEIRLLHKQLREHNERLEQRVRERTAQVRESHRETIMTLVKAAEHKDEDTGQHIQRISHYCREMAERLGMDAEFCNAIQYASPMHDIGKIAIPDHILLKPGPLTPEEWDVMKSHAARGARILADTRSPYLVMGAQIALSHHERWDGSGYPNGLAGEAIPLPARIMNICDVYDALRSRRPYKAPFDHARAVDLILRGDGRTAPQHFDPAVLAVFEKHHSVFCEIHERMRD